MTENIKYPRLIVDVDFNDEVYTCPSPMTQEEIAQLVKNIADNGVDTLLLRMGFVVGFFPYHTELGYYPFELDESDVRTNPPYKSLLEAGGLEGYIIKRKECFDKYNAVLAAYAHPPMDINPQMWEKEFYPRFKKLCGIAHQAGIKVFMHSCGKIGAIIPGLIKAGIDVLQFDQPDLHGIDNLAAYQEKGKITFWCPVDIQKTLQQKDETIIRTKAREMLDKLWKGRGGFIAGYYSDNQSIGLDPRWQQYACEEFKQYGVNNGKC